VTVQDIIWGSRFRIHHGVADRFHAGRIALASDAAALAAALDTAIEHDSAGPLAAYTAVRRPVAQQIVTITNRLTWLATVDRQLRALRNSALAALSPVISRRLAWRLSLLAYR
jgi:2-polyprenyl-6-methoxyphenol hydroxylase-like FAD-dependent oxidoreductase